MIRSVLGREKSFIHYSFSIYLIICVTYSHILNSFIRFIDNISPLPPPNWSRGHLTDFSHHSVCQWGKTASLSRFGNIRAITFHDSQRVIVAGVEMSQNMNSTLSEKFQMGETLV